MSSMLAAHKITSFDPGMHAALTLKSDQHVAKVKRLATKSAELKWLPDAMDKFKRDTAKFQRWAFDEVKAQKEADLRSQAANELLFQIVDATHKGEIGFGALGKAGVTTSLGYNYIDLRGPTALLFPVEVPFRNTIPRVGQQGAGVGIAAQWKTNRNVGSQYAGVPEGARAQVATPDESSWAAAYTALGVERAVTVEAEWAGEGFTPNTADEHQRGLYELWLQEEGIILMGNPGTGSLGLNGFQLGTAPAPLATLAATGGTIPTTTAVTGFCVLLTGLGNPNNAQYGYQQSPSVASGLVPAFTVTAPGTGQSITYNGGMSAISPASNTVTTATSTAQVTFTVQSVASGVTGGYANGTFGFAWFVSTNATPTTANAYLQAITQFPTYVQKTAPVTTGQAGNAAGLNADHSSQPTDFTGLFSWAASYGYWADLQGGTLTSGAAGLGQCVQVETALEYFYQKYQASVDAIWGSPDAIKSLSDAVLSSGGATTGFQFIVPTGEQNNVVAGVIVSGYRNRYVTDSPMGAGVIPLKIHPMIPAGTLYFDITKNPYPHSRIPATRSMFLMRDYYGYEWPAIDRAWRFGTYVNETMAHYCPWLTGVITGIAQS
jgi:hypothetical protein